MITKIDKSLSEVFDVQPANVKTSVTQQTTEQLTVQQPSKVVDKELNDDFTIARTMIQGILARGADAMENAILIANGTEDPKSFDAVANIIGKLTDASEKLVGLHEKKNKASTKQTTENPQVSGNVIANGPVFVGSTSELAKMIADSRKNQNT